MTDLPDRNGVAPRSATPQAAAARPARDRDGFFVVGPLRMRVPARPRPAPPPISMSEKLAGDEAERRDHIRRWARMMIVHLERTDFYAPQDGYVATLERLRHLLQREIDAVRQDARRTAA
jgi:hypothetical protein